MSAQLGLLENGVPSTSITVPSGTARDLDLTILIHNDGAAPFHYSGNTTASFVDAANTVIKREFRGFEVQPLETKNIGTIPVSIVAAPAGTHYTVTLQFDDGGSLHTTETTITVR